ncbi:MAG: TIGR04282 family arsenosugar biosynthesis glycosyltransferase, partial [Acidobacteriota bacterium]
PWSLEGRPVLVIFARRPEKGQVKSRLVPLVGEEGALKLHRAFMRDTLANLAPAARHLRAAVVLAVTGNGALDPADVPAGAVDQVISQAGGDLGRRLLESQRRLFRAGATAVVAVGSDSPTLPISLLTGALEGLRQVDAVFSPAEDGGYVLVGVNRPLPVLFHGIPWGTREVLHVSLRQLSSAGLSSLCLPGWYDVDDDVGLARLTAEIRIQGSRAPASAAVLKNLRQADGSAGCNEDDGAAT